MTSSFHPIIAACLSNLPHTVELTLVLSDTVDLFIVQTFHSVHDVCDLLTYQPNKIPEIQLLYRVRIKIHANEW